MEAVPFIPTWSDSPHQLIDSNTSILHAQDDGLAIHLYQRRIRYHSIHSMSTDSSFHTHSMSQWRWSVNKSMSPLLPTSQSSTQSSLHSMVVITPSTCCEILRNPSPQTDDEDASLHSLSPSSKSSCGEREMAVKWVFSRCPVKTVSIV